MKKIFSTIVFLLVFTLQNKSLVFAQTAKLEANAVGDNITISYTNPSLVTVQPIILDKEITAIPVNLVILPGLEPKLSSPLLTKWETKKKLDPNTVYYVRIFDIRTKGFLTENKAVEILNVNLISANFEKISAGTYSLTGQIDINKHKDTDPIPYSSIKVSGDITRKDTNEAVMPLIPSTINEKGEYTFRIINNSFDQNTWYNANLSFTNDAGANTQKSYPFNTKKGVLPETGKAADNFYDSNSYRLLAPIPGMTALLDPELCKLRQQTNPGEICDINAFLNFILSLIIGIAAVILVIRLIITGYGYMITDVPFVKAKLKGGFKDALLGLIFALASYVILNTINPRLVSNDFTIGSAEFDVERFGDVDANFVPPVGGGASFNKANFPKDVMCPGTGGRGSIRAIAGSWSGRATYGQDKKTPKGYPPRGNVGPGGTFMLDCSSYVATVLECAGIKPPQKASAATTYSFFVQMPGSEKVSPSDFVQSGDKIFVKGKELLPGDLVGWRGVGKNGPMGHVVIYVGGGMFRESQVGGWNMGNSVQGEKTLDYEMKAMGGKNVTQGYIRRVNP